MSHLPRRVAVVASAAVLLGACSGTGPTSAPLEDDKRPVVLTANVDDGAKDVGVDTLVDVDAEHGEVRSVTLTSADGKQKVPGEIADGGWTAAERLEPGVSYRLTVEADGDDGEAATLEAAFTTQQLSLDEQTYPAVAPLDGETVGVGMPVIVTFDVPVKDHRAFEENMHITSKPSVEGSWSWFSDREVHYRSKEYWPAGTKVNIDLDLNSVPAGGGVYGQQDQDIDFTVGRRVVSIVDMGKHTLRYTVDGKTQHTIPISSGDAGHQTRNGIKVVMEKFASVDMDAASTGVDSDDPGYYNMKGVKWAMRVTNSGEFLHAAPWNTGYFGRANMSHGCVGMSTADAGWIYQRSRRGDVVRFVGGSRSLEDRNGWTDWNTSWEQWTRGSALPHDDPTTAPESQA